MGQMMGQTNGGMQHGAGAGPGMGLGIGGGAAGAMSHNAAAAN